MNSNLWLGITLSQAMEKALLTLSVAHSSASQMIMLIKAHVFVHTVAKRLQSSTFLCPRRRNPGWRWTYSKYTCTSSRNCIDSPSFVQWWWRTNDADTELFLHWSLFLLPNTWSVFLLLLFENSLHVLGWTQVQLPLLSRVWHQRWLYQYQKFYEEICLQAFCS